MRQDPAPAVSGASPPPVPAAVPVQVPAHLVRDDDLSPATVAELFRLAAAVKAEPRRYAGALEGRSLAVIFEKRSLRTRFTFELGMKMLGGKSVFMDTGQQRILDREPVCDVARNLARWVDAVALRTFSHATVEEFARFSSVPIINGLSEVFHPCQSLTDYFTLREIFGDLSQARLGFVGGWQQRGAFTAAVRGAGRRPAPRGHSGGLRATSRHCGPGAGAGIGHRARGWKLGTSPKKPLKVHTPSTATFGPAWASSRRPTSAPVSSLRTA